MFCEYGTDCLTLSFIETMSMHDNTYPAPKNTPRYPSVSLSCALAPIPMVLQHVLYSTWRIWSSSNITTLSWGIMIYCSPLSGRMTKATVTSTMSPIWNVVGLIVLYLNSTYVSDIDLLCKQVCTLVQVLLDTWPGCRVHVWDPALKAPWEFSQDQPHLERKGLLSVENLCK